MDRVRLQPGDLRERVRVYRPAAGVNGRGRRTSTGLTEQAVRWALVQSPGANRRTLVPIGAGEQVTGMREIVMLQPVDVVPGDVLEVLTGPYRGTAWTAQQPEFPDDVWAIIPCDPSTDTLPTGAPQQPPEAP